MPIISLYHNLSLALAAHLRGSPGIFDLLQQIDLVVGNRMDRMVSQLRVVPVRHRATRR